MSAYQRLKDLLLDDERAARERADQRIDALERSRLTPAELPELIDAAGRGESAPRLARALAAPVADALGDAVVLRRQTIVDALFPVIGPAIRKALAEALRSMVTDLNAAIESSLTPRGLGWRIEAWRTGAPYAQVVLRHTLRWRVEHLFLIEPGSGLVIHRESAPGLPDLDSDAIAGMLTAIGEFVQDSVGRTAGATLGSATVGEHLLWVEDGPRARLACFIRGAPPAALRALLRQRLEHIHQRFPDPLAQLQAGATDVATQLDQALDLPAVERDARALDDAPPAQRARWPAWLLAIAVLGALLAWRIDVWRWAQRIDTVSAALADWPGLSVHEVSRADATLVVRGLLDPLADSPSAAISARLPANTPVRLATRGYISTDGPIVERRVRAVLGREQGIEVNFVDGLLTLAGELPAARIEQLVALAALVPGVQRVNAAALTPREARLHSEFDALLADIQALHVAFAGDADTPADEQVVLRMIEALRELSARSMLLNQSLRLRTWGATDGSGTRERNARLRAARAQWLARRLSTALGVEVLAEPALDESDPRATLAGRAAGVRVEQEAAGRR